MRQDASYSRGAKNPDDEMSPKQRFFIDNITCAESAGKPDAAIAPGERESFDTRPDVCWTPDRLTILTFSPPTGELLRECRVRLCEIELAGHTVEFTENNLGPKVDLTCKRLRQLRVGEQLTCVLENTGKAPVLVKLGYEGHTFGSRHNYIMGATAGRSVKRRRTFDVGPSCGNTDLNWRAPWQFRATRVWCHSKDSCGKLNLVDIRVGLRSQIATPRYPMPVEMFEDGVDVFLDVAMPATDITFVVENTGATTKHVEFELEGLAIDIGPFETQPAAACRD